MCQLICWLTKLVRYAPDRKWPGRHADHTVHGPWWGFLHILVPGVGGDRKRAQNVSWGILGKSFNCPWISKVRLLIMTLNHLMWWILKKNRTYKYNWHREQWVGEIKEYQGSYQKPSLFPMSFSHPVPAVLSRHTSQFVILWSSFGGLCVLPLPLDEKLREGRDLV